MAEGEKEARGFPCPNCGAGPGELCHDITGAIVGTHAERLAKGGRTKREGPPRSVRTVSGGAFEQGRRRH